MTFYTIIKSFIVSGALCFMCVPTINAVVAKPGLCEVTQPDGTIVNVRLAGNAFNKRAYTSDGYLLTTDEDGFYVFAECGSDGLPAATKIRALNPEMRTPEMNGAIAKISQSEVTDAFTLRDRRNVVAGQRQKGPGLFSTNFPSQGEQHALAILVNFSNKEFKTEEANDYFNRQLNEEGFSDNGATGSARDYFVSNSCGKFLPTFDVYGPVTLAHPISYYGANDVYNNDKRPHEMVIEACDILDAEYDVDFSQYDSNGDGIIDNVYVYYAGYGEADGGGANTVWPHSFDVASALPFKRYVYDGVQLNHYACSNELEHAANIPTGIGTFTHEFSHVMGLPDLYATDNSNAFTPGEWDILDVGSYNNNSCTPPNYSSFERYALGWIEPEILTKPGEYSLEALHLSNKAYLVPTDVDNEYFLFENRQHDGNDKYLPGHGMLVWHVDFKQEIWDYNIVNNDNKHQYVDLIEADNRKSVMTRAGDAFPGKSEVTEFKAEEKPAFLSWNKVSPGIELVDIAESEDGIISFTAKEYVSGIDDVVAPAESMISVCGREVSCLNGEAVAYDLSGKKVAKISAVPVELAPGLYIIDSKGGKNKILIK